MQNHFEVVGLTERFDESILLLQRAFGWRRPFYEKKNVGAVRRQKDELPAATRDLIARHNALDLELYEFARDRFEKSIAQLGANFPSDLRRFRRMNSYYPTFKRGLIAVSDQLRSLSQHVPLARPLSGKCRDYLYQYHGVGADESSADSSMNAPSVS